MEEARKLVLRSPLPGSSRCASPIDLPETTGTGLMELFKHIKDEIEEETGPLSPKQPWKPPGAGVQSGV